MIDRYVGEYVELHQGVATEEDFQEGLRQLRDNLYSDPRCSHDTWLSVTQRAMRRLAEIQKFHDNFFTIGDMDGTKKT